MRRSARKLQVRLESPCACLRDIYFPLPVPVPEIQFRRRRQAEDPEAAAGPPGLTSGDLGPDLGPDVTDDLAEGSDSLVSIGEECEEWPVQKCTLQEKVVKKTTPNTACEKIPKEICAPSNCVVGVSPKVIRAELTLSS